MQPSSLRVGPTSARNSASSNGSCPSRDFSNTTSVTASFGNFPSFDFREARFRALADRLRRRPPEDLVARFAIGAGLYLNRPKTPLRSLDASRAACGRRSEVVGAQHAVPVLSRRFVREGLLLRRLPASVEAVPIHDRVEHEGICPSCLAAINRVDREKDHVACARRHVNHRRMLRDFVAAFEQA
jgi:hypothetical protein